MDGAIRTELAVGAPGECPVAAASRSFEGSIDTVTRSASASDGTEEFAVDPAATLADPTFERIFEYDSRTIYRFDRTGSLECVCEWVERHGCPVSGIHASEGTLYVSFYAPDIEAIQRIITDLNEGFDDVRVRQLIRAGVHTERDVVAVDRSRLTARQREVLDTSYRMGYFDHPKRANAGEVADALGIAASTFTEHLAAAQRKLLETILQA